MLLGLHFFNNKFIKVEIRKKNFLRCFRKNFLNMFCWVRMKYDFSVFSPVSNFIKALVQYIYCFKRSRNYWKQSIIVVSSANNLIFSFKSVAKSFIYLREKRGPKIDLCDTRSRIHSLSEVFPIRVTLWTLSLKRFLINLSRFPLTPFCFNLNNKSSYHSLSKAFDTSKNTPWVPKKD